MYLPLSGMTRKRSGRAVKDIKIMMTGYLLSLPPTLSKYFILAHWTNSFWLLRHLFPSLFSLNFSNFLSISFLRSSFHFFHIPYIVYFSLSIYMYISFSFFTLRISPILHFSYFLTLFFFVLKIFLLTSNVYPSGSLLLFVLY